SLWFSEWLKWVQIALLIAICLDLATWELLVFALVTAGVANGIIGVYEYFGGSGALHLVVNETHFRAFGTFGQPNPFGGFMGLIAPVALMAALGYGVRLWGTWRDGRAVIPATVVPFAFYTTAAVLLSVDRKSTRLNSSHVKISYAVFCLKKK